MTRTRITPNGYIERKTTGNRGGTSSDEPHNYRNWWLVGVNPITVTVRLKEYIGKRIRLKVEVVE